MMERVLDSGNITFPRKESRWIPLVFSMEMAVNRLYTYYATAFLLKVFDIASLLLTTIKSIVVSWPRSGFTATVITFLPLTLPPF